MTVIFNDTLGEFGGSHTLMLRMCRWLRLHNYNVSIFCIIASNTEIVGSMKELGVQIDVIGNFDLKLLKNALNKVLEQDSDVKVINFTLEKWLNVECVKRMYGFTIQNLIYDIHPAIFYKGDGLPFAVLRKHARKEFRRIVLRAHDNNAIVSMEETNVKSVRNYYGYVNEYNPPILSLPMICERNEHCEDIIKSGFDSNLIMTATRADFPFKGYLMGLVDDFVELKKKYPELKMLIVSAGNDLPKLKDKIAELEDNVKNDINVHGWVTYPELIELMKKCKVFVGMGTTILDAALQYKIVVSSAFNTLEHKSCGFFSDNPFILGPVESECTPALEYLDTVLKMDFDEYKTKCHQSFEAVFNNYNIDTMMPALLAQNENSTGCVLTWSEVQEHRLNLFINKFRFRNKVDKNDYTEVIASNK